MSILNNEMDGLGINGFSQLGFLLNNGLRVIGPCAIFPRSILHWNVGLVQHAAACNLITLSLSTQSSSETVHH